MEFFRGHSGDKADQLERFLEGILAKREICVYDPDSCDLHSDSNLRNFIHLIERVKK